MTTKNNETGNKPASNRQAKKSSTIDLDPSEVSEVSSDVQDDVSKAAGTQDTSEKAAENVAEKASENAAEKAVGKASEKTEDQKDKASAANTPKDDKQPKDDKSPDQQASQKATGDKIAADTNQKAKAEKKEAKPAKGGAGCGSLLFASLLGGALGIGGITAIGQYPDSEKLPYIGKLYSGSSVSQATAELSSVQAKLSELEGQINQFKEGSDNSEFEEKIAALESQISEIAAANSENQSSDKAANNAEKNNQEVTALKDEIDALKGQAQEDQAKLEQLVAQLDSLTTSLSQSTTNSSSGNTTGEGASLGGQAVSAAAVAAATAEIAGLKAQVNQLQGRIEDVNKATGESSAPQNEELSVKLNELTERLGSLEGSAGAVNDLSSKQTEEITNLNQQIEEITGKVSGLEQSVNDTLPKELAAVREKAESASASEVVARSVASASLRSAAESSMSLAPSLAAVEALGGETDHIKELKALNAQGIPSLDDLSKRLDDLEDAMLASTEEKADGSYLDKLMTSAKSLVKVRPVGAIEGDTPEAILSRVRAALGKGDLNAAQEEWSALPDQAKEVSAEWAEAAKLRQQSMELIDTIVSDMAKNRRQQRLN